VVGGSFIADAPRRFAGLGYVLIHLIIAVVLVYLPVELRTTFVTGTQLVAHGVGDYILQSHWMALGKTSRWSVAALHAASYTVPFLLLTHSPLALLTIALTHAVIDRYRLARYVVWARNALGGMPLAWEECSSTGMPSETPTFLSVWLLIITDNLLHVIINGAAIRWL
jgi:hypothetical protein